MFDLAANFRPQQAAALTVFGILAFLGDRRVAAGMLALAGLCWVSLLPYLLGSPGVIAGQDRLEVVAFNVGISNPHRPDVAAFLRDEDPDLVFFFESSFEWENAMRAAELPLQIVGSVPAGRVSGVTVLARPSLVPGIVEVPMTGEVTAVSVLLGSERIEVLGVHPPSPTTGDRAARRDDLLREVGLWVRGRAGPVLVVGDLNATPWSHAFRTMQRWGGLTDSLRGNGLQPTWPDGWGVLSIPIDHVLHTAGIATEQRRTGPAFGSAHRPVMVTVGWAG